MNDSLQTRVALKHQLARLAALVAACGRSVAPAFHFGAFLNSMEFFHSYLFDIHARDVMLVALGVLLIVWCSLGVLRFLYVHLAHRADVTSPPPLPIAAHGRPIPPEPRLQVSPTSDWKT